jgi:hypothetical protein
MGKRGPRPVQDLWFWEREWCAIFKGLRDGTPTYQLQELRAEPRKLSRHPALRWELRNEMPVKLKVAETRIPGIPPERELWHALLRAASVEEVRRICGRSFHWLNPKTSRKPFVEILSTRADLFLTAKSDRRFPASERCSSDDKRLLYLARAMAGITLKRSPRRAIDLLAKGRLRHAASLDRQGFDSGTIILPLRFEFAVVNPNREVIPID